MKIASKNQLSFRKLIIAMMAVGPLAVLPSPVWAVLPTTSSFTVTSGTATLTPAGNTVNINFSDKAILWWGATAGTVAAPNRTATDGTTITNFVVDTGDTWNFASTGTILNKVVAGTNATNGSLGGAAAAAIINGQLLGSNAKVYVLANGGIVVGNGAQLNTQSLVLSTLTEASDATFITLGDLLYNGSSTGSITIGSISSGGSIKATAGSISVGGGTIMGDLILNSVTAASGIDVAKTAATTVNGNLSVTTKDGAITQTNALTVGTSSGSQTLTTNSGAANTTLDNVANDLQRVQSTTTGTGSVTIRDANIVTLGASSIAGDLDVKVGGKVNTTSISTDGAVIVTGNLWLDSTVSSNSHINIGNNSSVTGFVTAQTAGGNVTLTTAGNVTVGTILTNVTATQFVTTRDINGAAWPALQAQAFLNAAGVVTSVIDAGASYVYTAAPTVTFSAAPTGGTTATGTVALDVAGRPVITLTSGGSGYTAAPTVTFDGGTSGTSAATGLATFSLKSGFKSPIYWNDRALTIASPNAAAAVTIPANNGGTLTTAMVAISNGGSGYTAAPTVSIVGGGGTGAVATAVLTGDKLTGITITSAGTGYVSNPTVVIDPPGGAGAVVSAAQANFTLDSTTGLLSAVNIYNAGTGYGTALPKVEFAAVNTANNFSRAGTITVNATGSVTTANSVGFSANNPGATAGGLRGSQGASLRGTAITINAPVNVSGNTTSTFNATAGDISFANTVTANRITVTTAAGNGNITQTAAGIITTNNGTTGSTFTSGTGNITLDVAPNFFATGAPLAVTAANASIKQVGSAGSGSVVVGTTNVTGNYSIRTEAPAVGGLGYPLVDGTYGLTISSPPNIAANLPVQAVASATVSGGKIVSVTVTNPGAGYTAAPTMSLTLASGSPVIAANLTATMTQTGDAIFNVASIAPSLSTSGRNIVLGFGDGVGTATVVGGVLSATVANAGTITDNNDSRLDVFGGLNLTTNGGNIVLDAATAAGALTPSVRFGQVNASTGSTTAGSITLTEQTTLNLGNITAVNLTANSSTGGVVDSGTINLGGTANFTVGGTNNVVLDVATNAIPTIILNGGKDNSITGLNANTKLEFTNNSTGTTTIGTNTGFAANIGNVVTTGNLVVNSGLYIDVVGNANITGDLTLNATGNVPTASALGNLYTTNATVSGAGRMTGIGAVNLPALTYATAPTVTITGGGLAPITTKAVFDTTGTVGLQGEIQSVPIKTNGASYFPAPVITLPAPAGVAGVTSVQATATATYNSTTGAFTGITITNPGAGYTPGQLSAAGGAFVTVSTAQSTTPLAGATTLGTGAAAGTVATATVSAGGLNLAIAPTVTLTNAPSGGTTATATASINAAGTVTSPLVFTAGSGYTSKPLVTFSNVLGAVTTPAVAVANLGPTGQISGFNVTNSAANGGALPYVPGGRITIDVAGATTTSISQSSGTLKVSGDTSISAPGNAVLYRGNDFKNVVLDNTTGGALINDVTGVTISGIAGGSVEVRSGASGNGTIGVPVTGNASYPVPVSEANPWGVVLGNLNVSSLVVEASNGGSGNSGNITQSSGTKIHSNGLSRFAASNNAITVGNAGNNFGRVELLNRATDSSVTYTIVEDGTMKIGNITNRGTTNLTSRLGGIIEDPAADVVISMNGTLSATAAAGSILIGNTTHTAGTTTANVVTFNASAPTGAVAVTSNNSTALGNINANSLTVEVNGGNGVITQSGVAQVYGTASFTAGRVADTVNNVAANGGSITLTNNANNFGRIFLTSQGATTANIAITEGGTMNLGRITMPASSTGTVTATSVNGDIIDTGLGGLKPGGTVASPGTGIVTLSAINGNIALDDPTTDFPTTGGVVFTAMNVTLAPLGSSTLYLGGAGTTAVATGNLTVTSALGSIYNAGPVNVTGDAFFQSGSTDVLLTNSSNNFGTVKFAGRTVSITEAGHLTIATGSSATGAATFTTAGGDIAIVNRGGTVSLASTALFSASGNVTLPKLIQVSNTLTVGAAGTKDLSALSVSGDLGNKTPQVFGTGTYLPPLP